MSTVKAGNATKAIYWGSTSLFTLMMIAAAYGYLTSDFFARAFTHLGFPSYFRIELGVAKILGAVVLLAPAPRRLKEWAYAGFGITVVSAFIAHTAVDGIQTAVPPIIALSLLLLSYIYQPARREGAAALSASKPATPAPV